MGSPIIAEGKSGKRNSEFVYTAVKRDCPSPLELIKAFEKVRIKLCERR
jgi:hypothetical protein